ncbi:MAG: hypothetical protein JSS94_02685 [Bacteroidetes bacterium]|nr:hypothetical protein [Bacteroidota bacterium]
MDKTSIYSLFAGVSGLLLGILLAVVVWVKKRNRIRDLVAILEKGQAQSATSKNLWEIAEERLNQENRVLVAKVYQLESEKENLISENSVLKLRNQELDQLLKEGQPVIHSLKMKLIEANNTIVRYKARLGLKS